jgi:hypothetical protein
MFPRRLLQVQRGDTCMHAALLHCGRCSIGPLQISRGKRSLSVRNAVRFQWHTNLATNAASDDIVRMGRNMHDTEKGGAEPWICARKLASVADGKRKWMLFRAFLCYYPSLEPSCSCLFSKIPKRAMFVVGFLVNCHCRDLKRDACALGFQCCSGDDALASSAVHLCWWAVVVPVPLYDDTHLARHGAIPHHKGLIGLGLASLGGHDKVEAILVVEIPIDLRLVTCGSYRGHCPIAQLLDAFFNPLFVTHDESLSDGIGSQTRHKDGVVFNGSTRRDSVPSKGTSRR